MKLRCCVDLIPTLALPVQSCSVFAILRQQCGPDELPGLPAALLDQQRHDLVSAAAECGLRSSVIVGESLRGRPIHPADPTIAPAYPFWLSYSSYSRGGSSSSGARSGEVSSAAASRAASRVGFPLAAATFGASGRPQAFDDLIAGQMLAAVGLPPAAVNLASPTLGLTPVVAQGGNVHIGGASLPSGVRPVLCTQGVAPCSSGIPAPREVPSGELASPAAVADVLCLEPF